MNNQDDFTNTDHDKMQDAANSDAAKFNTDEQEAMVNDRQHAESETAEKLDQHTNDNGQPTNQAPLTIQGSIEEIEEDFSGTTNLTLDQLKKEKDPEGNDGE